MTTWPPELLLQLYDSYYSKQRRRLRLLYLQVRIGEQQAKEEVAEAAEIVSTS